MKFRIAESFADSLNKLTVQEQKAAKATAFDLQLNPANPGTHLHRVDRAKEKNFWSARVNRDLRFIIYRTGSTTTLCYAAHHDDAYLWAKRHVIERHPRTGAAQLVELRKMVRVMEVPTYVAQETPALPPEPALLAHLTDDDLLAYGVPTDWLDDVRAADEDTLLELAEHLPAEAAEALLVLATGGTPELPVRISESEDPFAHPGCSTSLPRNGELGGAGEGARLPMGEVDSLPAPGPTSHRRAALRRRGTRRRLRRHRENCCSFAPGGTPGTDASGCPRVANNLKRYTSERAPRETRTARWGQP